MPFEKCHSLSLEQSAQTEHSGCKRGSRLAPEVNCARVCVFVVVENFLCQGLRIIPDHPSSHLTRVTCQSPSWLHPSKDHWRLETAHILNAGCVWRSRQGFCDGGPAAPRHFPLNIIRRLQREACSIYSARCTRSEEEQNIRKKSLQPCQLDNVNMPVFIRLRDELSWN